MHLAGRTVAMPACSLQCPARDAPRWPQPPTGDSLAPSLDDARVFLGLQRVAG